MNINDIFREWRCAHQRLIHLTFWAKPCSGDCPLALLRQRVLCPNYNCGAPKSHRVHKEAPVTLCQVFGPGILFRKSKKPRKWNLFVEGCCRFCGGSFAIPTSKHLKGQLGPPLVTTNHHLHKRVSWDPSWWSLLCEGQLGGTKIITLSGCVSKG